VVVYGGEQAQAQVPGGVVAEDRARRARILGELTGQRAVQG
jgi:hypothetical protein